MNSKTETPAPQGIQPREIVQRTSFADRCLNCGRCQVCTDLFECDEVRFKRYGDND